MMWSRACEYQGGTGLSDHCTAREGPRSKPERCATPCGLSCFRVNLVSRLIGGRGRARAIEAAACGPGLGGHMPKQVLYSLDASHASTWSMLQRVRKCCTSQGLVESVLSPSVPQHCMNCPYPRHPLTGTPRTWSYCTWRLQETG